MRLLCDSHTMWTLFSSGRQVFEQEHDVIKNDALGKSLGWFGESC